MSTNTIPGNGNHARNRKRATAGGIVAALLLIFAAMLLTTNASANSGGNCKAAKAQLDDLNKVVDEAQALRQSYEAKANQGDVDSIQASADATAAFKDAVDKRNAAMLKVAKACKGEEAGSSSSTAPPGSPGGTTNCSSTVEYRANTIGNGRFGPMAVSVNGEGDASAVRDALVSELCTDPFKVAVLQQPSYLNIGEKPSEGAVQGLANRYAGDHQAWQAAADQVKTRLLEASPSLHRYSGSYHTQDAVLAGDGTAPGVKNVDSHGDRWILTLNWSDGSSSSMVVDCDFQLFVPPTPSQPTAPPATSPPAPPSTPRTTPTTRTPPPPTNPPPSSTTTTEGTTGKGTQPDSCEQYPTMPGCQH